MPELTESIASRIGDLRRFDPLLDALVASGCLADAEADLVYIAAEASRVGYPVRIALPGGSSNLAAAISLAVAVRAATHPPQYPSGPIALISGSGTRNDAIGVEVHGHLVAAGLSAVRLRADGLVQAVPGNRIGELGDNHRMLCVSPRSGWPDLRTPLGIAVLDQRTLGTAYDIAFEWAHKWAGFVHVVAELDPGADPGGLEVDWPLIAMDSQRWSRLSSWPLRREIHVKVAGVDPEGLLEARRRIADAARLGTSWPTPLAAAAGLSRALANVVVPLSLYDAHTVGTIAQPFVERIDQLADPGARHLPDEWAVFAETSWAGLRQGLLDATRSLEERNPKAEQIGLTIERLLAEGHDVDVWMDSNVHGRALQAHLLSAGFAISFDDFDQGRLVVRPFSEAPRITAADRVGVLCGLPASWHLPALVSAAIGGPLHVVTYPFEAQRAPNFFGWVLNAKRVERHDKRVNLVAPVLGSGLTEDPTPAAIELRIKISEPGADSPSHTFEFGEDVAEFAALADDEWLALALQDRERVSAGDTSAARTTLAFLVDPGPRVLLLAESSLVDRLVGGRLRPVPASSLEPGMKVLASSATGGVFGAIRPYLDRLQGLGTRFWLDQWDDALHAALVAAGGPSWLAQLLVADGATITAPAVAGWPSPYRIGPRDPANVERVAQIGRHALVTLQAARVHVVMCGVRVEHGRLGRMLARALRNHLSGDPSAFDPIEERIGVEIEEILGEVAVYTVLDRLAAGLAPASALGKAHSAAVAQELFEAQEVR